MRPNKDIKSMIRSVLIVILGNMTYALAIKLFLLPAGFITGGTTGIALTVTYFFDINMSLFILIFNIISKIIYNFSNLSFNCLKSIKICIFKKFFF